LIDKFLRVKETDLIYEGIATPIREIAGRVVVTKKLT